MKIAIIDYGAGNIKSIENALSKIGVSFEKFDKEPRENMVLSENCRSKHVFQTLPKYDGYILPGVGAASQAMEHLQKIKNFIQKLNVPFLGICLGMQILAEFSYEGNVECLKIMKGRVRKLPQQKGLKIPHMGWNRVSLKKTSKLTKGIKDDAYFYFVHSYYFDALQQNIIAEADYEIRFPVVLQYKNFFGTQFHPEKSGEQGMKILRNFCTLC